MTKPPVRLSKEQVKQLISAFGPRIITSALTNHLAQTPLTFTYEQAVQNAYITAREMHWNEATSQAIQEGLRRMYGVER